MNYVASEVLKQHDEYYPNSNLKHVYFQQRNEIVNLTNSIEIIWKKQELDKTNFEVLFTGLQNSWVVVYYYILGTQLNLMLGKIDGIEELFFFGIKGKSWKTRFNTVVILKALDNQSLKSKIIDLALIDKSSKVREMAEDVKMNYYSSNETPNSEKNQKSSWLRKFL